ncbi:MAG: cell division protein ZapA [Alphaproteobacteria bacterium]
MGEVNINISGRNYGISCQDGQEQRVHDLGQYVDARVKEISKAGAAANETHLLVLTTLMLADEIFEQRENPSAVAPQAEPSNTNEAEVAEAINTLATRIDQIAKRIQAA